jgi:hypothetical protein
LFALANGRTRYRGLGSPEENLHYWKEVAEEQGCYESRYAFATDHGITFSASGTAIYITFRTKISLVQ